MPEESQYPRCLMAIEMHQSLRCDCSYHFISVIYSSLIIHGDFRISSEQYMANNPSFFYLLFFPFSHDIPLTSDFMFPLLWRWTYYPLILLFGYIVSYLLMLFFSIILLPFLSLLLFYLANWFLGFWVAYLSSLRRLHFGCLITKLHLMTLKGNGCQRRLYTRGN